jgi:antitoxin ParD1/3/4/toxin ParE1/3/4
MARYQLTRSAKTDLLKIWNYIAEDNFDAADRLRDEIRAACRRLADMPYLGHVREDILDATHRFWSVRSYLIVYRPETKPLQVIRIIHGARDLKTIFGN